jgi:glycosyltransferase involved in cell wall biosynthesis/putative flippase GtrA
MIRLIIKLLNKHHTFIKFGVAGVLATGTNFLVLAFLIEILGIWYLISAGIAFLVSFGVSFYLQKFWTFRDDEKEGMHKQAIAYFAVVLAGLVVNLVSMYILVDFFGMHYLPAQLIITVFIAVMNFVLYKYVIFKRVLPSNILQDAKEKKKKILITTPIYPPMSGGPATYVKLLKEELPAHGLDVQVITYADKEDCPEKIDYNNKVIRIDRSETLVKKYFQFFRAVNKLLPEADIVYTMDQINAGLPTALACFLRARKFILKVVGDYAWEQAQEQFGIQDNLDEFQEKKYTRKIERWRSLRKWVAKEAEQIITPSEYLKKIVAGWGIKEDRIKVIYNAVRTVRVEESKEELRERLGFSGLTIITCIRLLPWKGWQALIEIMPRLLKLNPEYKLIIVGNGPDQKKFDKILNKSEARNSIHYIPSLEHCELMKYFKASDAFILNTNYEGLPHVVIEAQQLETPVLTTIAGGNREVVEHEKSGLIFEYNNKEEMIDEVTDYRG